MTTTQNTFGISLGNDSLIISVVQDENAVIVVNQHGSRATPSAVAFSENEVVVGDTARTIAVKRAREVVHTLPFVLSNSKNVDLVRRKKLGYELHVEDDEIVGVITQPGMDPEAPTTTHTFVDAFTPLFKFSKNEVEAFLGNSVSRCVLTLPEELCDKPQAVEKLALAAQNAGLSIDRVIRASAACIVSNPEVTGNVMLVDMGALSTSITCSKVNGGLISDSNIAYCNVGGRDFDDVIAKHFAEEFRRKSKIDIDDDKRAKRKLLSASEVVKRTLSQRGQGSATIEALCQGVDFTGNITKSRFDAMASVLLPRLKEAVAKALNESSFDDKKPTSVMLVGGGVMNSLVKSTVDSTLRDMGCNVTSVVLKLPQEVSALGAGMQANLCCLSGVGVPVGGVWQKAAKGTAGSEVDPVGLQSVVTTLAHDIGLVSASGAVKVVLPQGSLLPAEGKLTLPAAGVESVLVKVAEIKGGEPTVLCELPVSVAGESPVAVTMQAASSGEVEVACSAGAGKVSVTVPVQE